MRIGVIIPALNESAAVPAVIAELRARPAQGDAFRVVVCDNGSTDDTAALAAGAGAEVVHEPVRGYGAACLRGLAHLGEWPDLLVFADADGAADLERLDALLDPLRRGQADLVIGRRFAEPGSMTLPQRFGTALFCALVRLRWRVRCSDLGPFRAIRRSALERLRMADTTWGWTLEMQIKAVLEGLRVVEIPVRWRRRRAGASKISGTLAGTLRACGKITWTFARFAATCRRWPGGAADRVIGFVKYPRPGAVKTRLAAAVGNPRAAWIYRRLAHRTHRRLLALQSANLVELTVFGSGGSSADFRQWLPGARRYQVQPDGDLSVRLGTAFEDAFADGARRVAVVGTDNPALDGALVCQALASLDYSDAAVIPNTDGGYALIALSRSLPELFGGIDWSSDRVLRQTRERARQAGLTLVELPAIVDVDRPEDLHHLPPLLSVVIPALNEAQTLTHNLPVLMRQVAACGEAAEVVVVDGGSTDRTAAVAAACEARVIQSAAGRGRQLNTGSAAVAGEWLWFVHADCRIPPGGLRALLEVLSRFQSRSWGYFEPRLDSGGLRYRLIDIGISMRSKMLRLPFGDQGLFVHRDALAQCGGFVEHGAPEDRSRVTCLATLGPPIRMAQPLEINSRRWRRDGIRRTTASNGFTLLPHCARAPTALRPLSDYNSGNALPADRTSP